MGTSVEGEGGEKMFLVIGRALDRIGLDGPADRYVMVSVVAWLVWVAASPLWSGRLVPPLSPYLVAPVVLLGGIVAGRALAPRWSRWHIPAVAAALALIVLVAVPFYANAQASVGGLLVALAGLILLTGLPETRDRNQAANLITISTAVAVLGVLLAARAQAATVLALPLAIIVVGAVVRRNGPPRPLVGCAGFALVLVAAAVVAFLGNLAVWPAALTGGGSLSSARHTLWSDALSLWEEHPIAGGGVGSFLEHSAIAASNPHLETVHSSVLQVSAELGFVGAVLFLCILASGMAVAAQGPRPQALVAMLTWTALAVHSMIDHLYEFPVVTVLAGIVLGWGGRHTAPPPTPPTGMRDP